MTLYKTLTLLSLISFTAYSLPKFVLTKPEVIEQFASYSPGKLSFFSERKEVVMPPMRGVAQFGGINEPLSEKAIRPYCGPAPETNSMNCFDFNHSGRYLESFPVPGKISSTSLFYENAWLIGTTKGFLMKVEANNGNNKLPKLDKISIPLWGAYSREFMANLRPKTIYAEETVTPLEDSKAQYSASFPEGIKWVFAGSSSFRGTPIIKNGLVYIFSANQYLHAFNWDSGKLVWAVRLAPDSRLRFSSDALLVTNKEVIVGNSLGNLLILNPLNGALLWSWQVPSANESQRTKLELPAGPDKFYGVIALPLLFNRDIIVSNAESMTQRISLDTHAPIWSFPSGSVAQPKIYKNNILLGTSLGKIVSLNEESGSVNWKVDITDSSPIISLYLNKNELLFAVTRSGEIYVLNPDTGKILAHNYPTGEVNGEFYSIPGQSEACLSFAANGFRCFRARL